ncbi:MAG: GLUG motif-containing protein, partial [Candidatus Omnitrophota bacterium]
AVADSSTTGRVAMFRKISTTAILQNITVTNATVTGAPYAGVSAYTGVLVGETTWGADINDCHVLNATITHDNSTIAVTNVYVGGISGSSHAVMQNCTSSGNIYANIVVGTGLSIGGLVGFQTSGASEGQKGKIINSSSTMNIYNIGDACSVKNTSVGGICGQLFTPGTDVTEVNNCHWSGIIDYDANTATSNFLYVGGIVGQQAGLVACSSAKGNVKSVNNLLSNHVGGAIGVMSGTYTIMDSYADCNVSISYASGVGFSGGLVGRATAGNPIIINCYAKGSIDDLLGATVAARYGGICGYATNLTATNCWAAIDAYTSGSSYCRGFVGYNATSTYSSCRWDSTTSTITADDSIAGTDANTTAQMQTMTTFTGYDFLGTDRHWRGVTSTVGMYPMLVWEVYPYSGGAGTATNPYKIGTDRDYQFATEATAGEPVQTYYKITGDITYGNLELLRSGGGSWIRSR